MKLSTVITFTATTVVLNGLCLHASNTDANPANKISIGHDVSFDDASIIGNISETDSMRDTTSLIGNDTDTNLPWSQRDLLGVRSSFISISIVITSSFTCIEYYVSKIKTFLTISDPTSLLFQNTTLVISDSDESDFYNLLKSLDETPNHPFSDILIMVPNHVEFVSVIPVHSARIHFVSRGTRPDSLFLIRQVRQLMVHNSSKSDNQPVVTYSNDSPMTCFDFPQRSKEYTLTKMISLSSMEQITGHSGFVYETDNPNEFCELWKSNKEQNGTSSYIAYLQPIGQAQEFYHFPERRMPGSFPSFIPLKYLPVSMGSRRLLASSSPSESFYPSSAPSDSPTESGLPTTSSPTSSSTSVPTGEIGRAHV